MSMWRIKYISEEAFVSMKGLFEVRKSFPLLKKENVRHDTDGHMCEETTLWPAVTLK